MKKKSSLVALLRCNQIYSILSVLIISSFLVKFAESRSSTVGELSIRNSSNNFGLDGLQNNSTPIELKWNHPLLALFFLSVSLVTVFGNLLVICAVFRESCLQNATNYYIISLVLNSIT